MRMGLGNLDVSSWISFGLTASAKATVLLLIAALAGLALRRHSSASRHLLWTVALLGALAIPIASRFVPSWPLTAPATPTLSSTKPTEAIPFRDVATRPRLLVDRQFTGIPPEWKIQASIPRTLAKAAPVDWWSWLAIVWASGAAVSALPLVVGLLNLVRIIRLTSLVDEPEWTELVRTLSGRLGLRRRVRLVKSSGATTPMTWGWLQPVVLLPSDSEGWPAERRRVVLLHELAHVKRLDCLTQQLAQLSCAAYWFNPLSWWASMRMRVEREKACDDLVLLSGARPSEYAGHLLALARGRRCQRGVSMAVVAMARGSHLEGRLRAILDPRVTTRTLNRRTAAAGLMVAGGIVVLLAGVRMEADAGDVNVQLPNPGTGSMTVRGRVLDAEGKPVAGAHTVLLAKLFRPLTSSYENTVVKGQGVADDQGWFRLDLPRVPDGDKTLVVTAPGLGAGFHDVSGSEEEEITIRLGAEQIVRGRFIDLQGSAAAKAMFHVSALWKEQPELSGLVVTTPLNQSLPPWLGPLHADAQGRFTLHGLPRDAEVILQIRDDRFALQDLRIATGHAETAKERVLALAPPHLLEGRVTFGDTGQPAAGARLHVIGYQTPRTTQSFDRIEGQAGPDGRFRISASVAHHYGIVIDPPAESPYFLRRLTLDATKGERQEIDVTLERGILVRGRIYESESVRPVAGAVVVYRPKRKNNPLFKEDLFASGGFRERSAVSGADGSFRIAALPGQGHLLVKGPNPDFIPVGTSAGELDYDPPGGARLYPVGLLALDLGASVKAADVAIPLRRGVAIDGRVVGPGGQTVPGGAIYSEAVDSDGFEFDFSSLPIQHGRFILTGLDPKKTISAFAFDPERQLGASLQLSVPRDGRPLTVTLQPCGSARVRFVDRSGKALAKVMLSRPLIGLEMSVRLSSSGDARDRPDNLATTLVENIDGDRYRTLSTDDQGWITFPSLIPGATYRVMAGEGGWVVKKEFVAEAGKTVELSEITVMNQGEPIEGSKRAQGHEDTKP